MPFSVLSGIGSVLGGLGGLFGKKKKDPTPRQNLLSQAQGARQASDKYGFNPLTMLQYGQPGGAIAGGGGPAPLASIDLITGGLKDINDVVSGDAARRRAADQLEVDLAQVKIDQAKNQMALDHTRAAQTATSPLGRRAVTVGNETVRDARPVMPPSGAVLGREIDREKMVNTSGVGQIENPILGPQPYYVPMVGSDGLDEIAAAGAAVGYQKQVDWKHQLGEDLRTVTDTVDMGTDNVEWTDALTPQWKAGRKPDLEDPEYKAAKRRVWRRTGPLGGFGTGIWRHTVPLWNYDVRKWKN